jgi:hypothetical protein
MKGLKASTARELDVERWKLMILRAWVLFHYWQYFLQQIISFSVIQNAIYAA